MNPTLKLHRHPGLWSLPQKVACSSSEELSSVIANSESELAQRQHLLKHVLRQAQRQAKQSEQRWVTLVGQPHSMNSADIRRLLKQAGVHPQQVRWIRSLDNESCAWAAEQACLLDNSCVIIAWLQDCLPRDALRLQLARRHTQANVLIFQQNILKTPLH